MRFAPGARNAWHAHAVGQTVHVTEGVGRIQARGGEVLEIRAGDTVYTPPGEWHWHGAAPDRFMTHLAIFEAPAEGPETEWASKVTDAEYLAPAERSRRMTAWTADELARIGRADEIRVASRRADGSLTPFVTIWAARLGRRPLRALGPRPGQRLVPPGQGVGLRPDPGRRRRA